MLSICDVIGGFQVDGVWPAVVLGVEKQDRPVRVKLDAFPFQRHGILAAHVTSVGRDAVASQQVQQRGQRVVPVRMALHAPPSLRLPTQANALTPGMLLTAEVVTGQRTVMSYFTDPLIRLGDEGLRER